MEQVEHTKESRAIQLQEHRAIVYLPTDAVEIEINATVYQNGKLSKVSRKLSNKEIQQSFKDAEDNYIEDNDVFVLTENGIQALKDL